MSAGHMARQACALQAQQQPGGVPQQRDACHASPRVVRWADEPAALTDIAAALDGTGPPVIVADGRVELLPRGGAQ